MKVIRSKNDLALHGASPAFAEPLHVGRPNLGGLEGFNKRVEEIIRSRWLTNDGPMVRRFESQIAELLGVKHCVAICNGTVALEIAIRALGLTGEVIVPSYTFVATAHALQWQAIKPVFADIDPKTHNLDPESVRRSITPRTSGIMGVHLWGRPAPVHELESIAREHGLRLMFDAAHAFGCTAGGTMIGRFGECEVLSFHATKFLHTFEGGAIVTDDDALAEKMRFMRNFGFRGYDEVVYEGTNGKMVEICAAMGLTNLENMGAYIAANRRNYDAYRHSFDGLPGMTLLAYDDREKNNYQYVVIEIDRSFPASRDEIVVALHAENILARRYFWPGCHRMSPYRELNPNAAYDLPSTEEVAGRVIVLPTGNALPADAPEVIGRVIEVMSQ